MANTRYGKTIHLRLEAIDFPDGNIKSNWFESLFRLMALRIIGSHIDAIERNAFNSESFQYLCILYIENIVDCVRFHIMEGAFNGLKSLRFLTFNNVCIVNYYASMFRPLCVTLTEINLDGWHANLNINELFHIDQYKWLRSLQVKNVREPKFRLLHRDNFTSIRNLNSLILMECGIEVIDEHAFDVIARKLDYISLYGNPIKIIGIEMFRLIFESKNWFKIPEYGLGVEDVRLCTCHLVEMHVMQHPFLEVGDDETIVCQSGMDFDSIACGIHRNVDPSKLCLIAPTVAAMRLINVRMTYRKGIISMQTNFTSKFRMVFVNLDQPNSKCIERTSKANYRCVKMDVCIENIDLHAMAELRNAEIMSIAAIPFLLNFGTHAMHLMTVRQSKMMALWINEIDLVTMAIISSTLSASIGFIAVILVARLVNYIKTKSSHD